MEESKVSAEESKGGIKTNYANVVVCQCGSVSFDIGQRTSTQITLKCTKCEANISIKGSVAPIHVRENEIAYAITEKVIRPDPEYNRSKKPKTDSTDEKKTLADLGYRTLRFKISAAQDEIVQRAMEIMRVLNCQDEQFKNKQWQGSALELICAEFIAGADPRAISIVAEMEEQVTKAKAAQLVKDSTTKLTKRKIRKIRTDTRERMYVEVGLAEKTEEYEPPPLSPSEKTSEDFYQETKEKQKEQEELDTRILDEDRLSTSIGECLVEFGEAYQKENGNRPGMLMGKIKEFEQLKQRFEKEGGNLYQVTGDKRTKNKAGNTPRMFIWLEEGIELPEISLAYDDAMEKTSIVDSQLEVERIEEQDGKSDEKTDS